MHEGLGLLSPLVGGSFNTKPMYFSICAKVRGSTVKYVNMRI